MADDVLLATRDVEITPKIARFGTSTYPIANIGGLTIDRTRWMNPIALFLLCFSFGALFSGFTIGVYMAGMTLGSLRSEVSMYFFGAAAALGAIGLLMQLIWPRRSLTLTLKTSTGDIEALASDDSAYVAAVQGALEAAFAHRT
jgi:Family of unknown function (DUF6232)